MDDILILDDNTIDREHIKRVLDGKQFTLHVAGNAVEAIQVCNEHPVSIALIDYVLGTENGIEVYAELTRAHPFLRGILISGYLDYGLLTRIVESRFDDCLSKPVAAEALYDSLMNSMRHIINWRARFKECRNLSKKNKSDDDVSCAEYMQEIDEHTYVVNGKSLIEQSMLDALILREWRASVYLCIDLSGLKSINSTDIGSFVALKNSVKKSGGDVGLYGMSDHILSVMKSLRLFDIFYGSESKTEILQKMCP